MPETCRVFISYAHDSDNHKAAVLDLSNFLLNPGGLDSMIDRYVEDGVPESWPKWMESQVRIAKYVLVVCSERYHQRYYADPAQAGRGHGVKFESILISNAIYKAESINAKFLPVVFSDDDLKYIPDVLAGQTYFKVADHKGRMNLYRKLTHQPKISKPAKSEVIMLLDDQDTVIDVSTLTADVSLMKPLPIIKVFEEMKPGTKIVQAFFGLPAAKRWSIASELGLVEGDEVLSNANIEQLSKTFLERAYKKHVLMALWSKLFDESIDPNPFKNTSK